MANKSPAFQFYPKDWFSSRNVRRMTLEQRGAYWELLAHAWLEDDCSLPNDDKELAFLSGLNERWPGCKENILKCFEKKGDKLFNPRLLLEEKKQGDFRKQCSDAGKKSAEMRKNKELAKVGSTNVQPESQGRCNSSSSVSNLLSSSSSTSLKNKETAIVPLKKNELATKEDIPFKEIVDDLNLVLDSNYHYDSADIVKLIKARWKDGYRLQDFQKVHRVKNAEWRNNPDMAYCLRPQTLYTGKFSSYVNQIQPQTQVSDNLAKSVPAIEAFMNRKKEE